MLAAACGQPSDRLTDEEAAAEQGPAVLDEANTESETVAAPVGPARPGRFAGPILYKAVGNEPGWSLTVRAARMDYAGDYGAGEYRRADPARLPRRPRHLPQRQAAG